MTRWARSAASLGKGSVEVVLQPGNEAGLNSLLNGLYTPGSADYGHWLAAGQFDSEFAPSQATVQAMTAYLQGKGLTVQRTSTPFLLRAIGSSAQIDAAFATTIDNYRNAQGVKFYSNATPASVPASLASSVLGVVGLTNTVRLQPTYQLAPSGSTGHSGTRRAELRDPVSDHPGSARGDPAQRTVQRLRRRPWLQRPDPVADQQHLQRPQRGTARQGRRRHRGRVRALRLQPLGHHDTGRTRSTALTTTPASSTSMSTADRWLRIPRSARRGTRASTATVVTSRSRPTSNRI